MRREGHLCDAGLPFLAAADSPTSTAHSGVFKARKSATAACAAAWCSSPIQSSTSVGFSGLLQPFPGADLRVRQISTHQDDHRCLALLDPRVVDGEQELVPTHDVRLERQPIRLGHVRVMLADVVAPFVKRASDSTWLSCRPIRCMTIAETTRSGAVSMRPTMNDPAMHIPATWNRSTPRWSISAGWSSRVGVPPVVGGDRPPGPTRIPLIHDDQPVVTVEPSDQVPGAERPKRRGRSAFHRPRSS